MPLPASGIWTISTDLSGAVVVVIGPDMPGVRRARSVSDVMPAWTCGLVTSSAWTATTAGSAPPGKADWMRS